MGAKKTSRISIYFERNFHWNKLTEPEKQRKRGVAGSAVRGAYNAYTFRTPSWIFLGSGI